MSAQGTSQLLCAELRVFLRPSLGSVYEMTEWLRLTTPAEEALRQAEGFDWRVMGLALLTVFLLFVLIDWWQMRRFK